MTEAGLLKQFVESAVQSVVEVDADILKSPLRRPGGLRTYALLHPEDKLLLRERAASRHMGVATYISVLVRAHLRNLSPLPKAELMALKLAVAELGAIGRNLNQATRLAHQGAGLVGLTREDLVALLRACEALRVHTKDLLKANALSWRAGHASDSHQGRSASF